MTTDASSSAATPALVDAGNAPASAAFTVRPDPHCLRGLHFVYTVPAWVDVDGLIARVRAALPRQLVEGTERWASVTVVRLIVQFRFELRFGARPGEISFIHRVFANPAQRASDRDWFEAALCATLADGAAP